MLTYQRENSPLIPLSAASARCSAIVTWAWRRAALAGFPAFRPVSARCRRVAAHLMRYYPEFRSLVYPLAAADSLRLFFGPGAPALYINTPNTHPEIHILSLHEHNLYRWPGHSQPGNR